MHPNDATFTGPNNIIHFLRNDIFFAEDPSGFLDRIRLYDGVLTSAQVVSLFQGGDPPGLPSGTPGVPEPGSLALLGIGAVAMLGYCWRRRRLAA